MLHSIPSIVRPDLATVVNITGGGGGGVTPFFEWDPNDYSTTQQLIDANTNGSSLGDVQLVTGQTLHDGSTGNVMRSTYTGDGTTDDCNYDLSIGGGSGLTEEFWIEFYLRFNAAWSINSDDKTFFFNPQTGSRWEIHYGLFGTRVYGGPSANPNDFAVVSDGGVGEPLNDLDNDLWDGNWHRHRVHGRYGTGTSGAFWWWIDDEVLLSDSVEALFGWGDGEGINTGDGNWLNTVRLGANADPTGGANAYRDWGELKIYTSDPGWASTN